MSTILAGHFQLQNEVMQAREELMRAGFPDDQITGFYLSQPGQHDLTPLGGDDMISPGAKESPEGVVEGEMVGGAVGAVLGAATIPIAGPLGPVVGGLVGAHAGSLYAFHKMKEHGEHERFSEGGENEREPRPAGMLVAVAVEDPDAEERALDVLRRLGAHHIERAEGHISNGDWTDFDPRKCPDFVH